MKYSIIYSSKTGNTALLAKNLKETLPKNDCIYYGEVDEKALDADLIFIGFWTDKGTCDETVSNFLKTINNHSSINKCIKSYYAWHLDFKSKVLDIIEKIG